MQHYCFRTFLTHIPQSLTDSSISCSVYSRETIWNFKLGPFVIFHIPYGTFFISKLLWYSSLWILLALCYAAKYNIPPDVTLAGLSSFSWRRSYGLSWRPVECHVVNKVVLSATTHPCWANDEITVTRKGSVASLVWTRNEIFWTRRSVQSKVLNTDPIEENFLLYRVHVYAMQLNCNVNTCTLHDAHKVRQNILINDGTK